MLQSISRRQKEQLILSYSFYLICYFFAWALIIASRSNSFVFSTNKSAYFMDSGEPTPTENIPAPLMDSIPASASSTPTHSEGSSPNNSAPFKNISGSGFPLASEAG